LKWAEDKTENIELLCQKSDLPDVPELEKINDLLVQIRAEILLIFG
jgi:hypothetical protein